MQRLSDQEIFDLILKLEDELFLEGMEPKARHFELPRRAMQRLGYTSFIFVGEGSPDILNRIRAIHSELYRKTDVAMGGLHGGAFMFRGIAVKVYTPIMFGSVRIDPLELCDLNPLQKQWLTSEQKYYEQYLDTFSDVFDVAGGLHGLGSYDELPDTAQPLFTLASFQLQAASATLCAAFDTRGAIQSSIIGAELALKAAVASKGANEADLKKFGHNLSKLATAIAENYPTFDVDSVNRRIATLPSYVRNRYSEAQPSRLETGNIVMASQFVAAASMRALTNHSFKPTEGWFETDST